MPASLSTDPFARLSESELTVTRNLVRQVLQDALTKQDFIMPSPPEQKVLQRPGACFVSIYVDGQLRGCTGSIKAHIPLWQDICKRAYTTTQDSRFAPLVEADLENLTFKINILTPMMAIKNRGEEQLHSELKPGIDGLLLKDEYRQAVFLPTVWNSLPQPQQFVDALKHKGGWPPDYWSEAIELFRFYTFEYES